MREAIEKYWNQISATGGGFLRINTEHPLEWYIGFLPIGRRTLLLISDADPGSLDSSRSMAVRRGRREVDNRWTLTFELQREEQLNVFVTFCSDIIECSRSAHDSSEAVAVVVKRYKQWNRLLEYQREGLMDESSRKGLIGELLFLGRRLDGITSTLQCVKGWVGPDGADQDFVYDGRWYEVKAVGMSSSAVTITSLEQLDCADTGELFIFRIDPCPPERIGSFSLNDIVQTVLVKCSDDPDASALLEAKLNKYGYIALPNYDEQKYHESGFQRFFVDGSFPRITRAMLPPQIEKTRYTLSIAAIGKWEGSPNL